MRGRKLQRLPGYDYSRSGYYYVTIKVKKSDCPLARIENNKIILYDIGKVIDQQWLWLSKQYKYINLDEYIIMPDHFHGIIEINDNIVGNGRDRSLREFKIKPLPEIIGAFKTTSSKKIHELGYGHFKWQKSFYDRIMRKCELNIKREYIKNNPMNYNKHRSLMDN